MAPTVYPFNPRRTMAILIGGLAFAVIGVFFLIAHDTVREDIGGALAVPFGLFALAVSVEQMIKREPQLTITNEGIRFARGGEIAWHEVYSVGVRTIKVRTSETPMLEIVLNDPAAYVSRLTGTRKAAAAANKASGFSPANIPAVSGVPFDQVIAAMRAHNPALRLTGQPV